MPEVPEIRFLRELIKDKKNRKLIKIIADSKGKIKLPHVLKIKYIGSKGKLIYFDCGEYFVHLRMGLTGWIALDKLKYTKYILEFDDDTKIYVDDKRKFSSVKIIKKSDHLDIINRLGHDILTKEYSHDYFYENIKKYNKSLPSFLLDQGINAGIGNYIKNDSLYISGISPLRKTGDLSDKEILKLYNAIRHIAFSNLVEFFKENKIVVPKDIIILAPKKLTVPYKFKVYRQKIDPLGNRVVYKSIGGRGTYYVPSIQK
jgi:formamidopyrimidine-DNA glycosylase